jgi:predicted metalloprotease with PDZ domain
MKIMKNTVNKKGNALRVCIIICLILQLSSCESYGNESTSSLNYTISMPDPANHLFHVTLFCKGLKGDTIDFKMPAWMPGYYQIMGYSKEVRDFTAFGIKGNHIAFIKTNSNSWKVIPGKNNSFNISYDVYSARNFVASNYLDSTHGYIVPAATFMYPSGYLDNPVSVKVIPFIGWKDIATGLEKADKKTDEYTASDFNLLYDCPILIGNLEELPSFKINGIDHYFIAYKPGIFNREQFISGLEKTVKAGINLIGDIPYKEYTFIGI